MALQGGRGRSPAPALRRRSRRGRLRSGPWRRAGGDDPPHLVAQLAHPLDDRFVHPVQAVEVFGASGEVVEAAGADDDAEHVRGAGLIHRDQPVAQRPQRPLQVGAQLAAAALGDVELGDGAGRARPAWRRAGRGRRPRGCGCRRPRRSGGRSGRRSGRSSSSARPCVRALRPASTAWLRAGTGGPGAGAAGAGDEQRDRSRRRRRDSAIATRRFLSIGPRLAKSPEIGSTG